MKYRENKCACQQQEPFNSQKLKIAIEMAIMSDCPASTPLIPAKILMELVQNTASMPMYT